MDISSTKASSIQLCQWWLKQIVIEPYHTLADLGDRGALALSASIFEQNPDWKWRKTAMDVITLADSLMLHEMAHAVRTTRKILDYAYCKTSKFNSVFKLIVY